MCIPPVAKNHHRSPSPDEDDMPIARILPLARCGRLPAGAFRRGALLIATVTPLVCSCGAPARAPDARTRASAAKDAREMRAAPSIRSATWFNSAPLDDTDLRGKVIVVDFWTYG
jgi:hypothetical protein